MSTTYIVLPVNANDHGGAPRSRPVDVSTPLDAGSNDIQFTDEAGNEVNAYFLNCSSDASVVCRAKGQTDAQALPINLVHGGWHGPYPVSTIFKASTTGSAGIIARAA
jgi:hypothetical protein